MLQYKDIRYCSLQPPSPSRAASVLSHQLLNGFSKRFIVEKLSENKPLTVDVKINNKYLIRCKSRNKSFAI